MSYRIVARGVTFAKSVELYNCFHTFIGKKKFF
jgi:hypothetical protein